MTKKFNFTLVIIFFYLLFTDYSQANFKENENDNKGNVDGEKDELHDKAVNIIKTEGKASTSFYKENYKLDITGLQELWKQWKKKVL